MAHERLINRTIDNIIIQSRLQDGGMSMVYRGYDTHRRQDVVVKILHDRYINHPEVVERFQREIELAKELHHTHIVPFFGFGTVDGTPYISLKYLPGGTLDDAMKRGGVSLPDTAKWLTQIASALDYAHRRGVIHRDIKPGNVLLNADGDASLTDFGIARVMDAAKLTRTDVSMPGTARFMSPEQAIGKQIDHRSDIYSLAVLTYTLCVGTYPFDGANDVAIIMQHINGQPPRPNGRNPQLPRTLDKVILRGLAKNPASRYDSAGEFAAAFATALGIETDRPPTDHSRPDVITPTPYAHVRRSPGRWFAGLITLGMMASIGAILALGFTLLTGGGSSDDPAVIVREVSATPSLTPLPTVTPFFTVAPPEIAPPISNLPFTPTPIMGVDAIFPTAAPDQLTATPRPQSSPASPSPTATVPYDWVETTRLYVQIETGVRPFVGGDPADSTQLQPGDIITIGRGIVEGGARREWFNTSEGRWWYVIPTRGDAGWLPQSALGEERPVGEGTPTRTATPTPTTTITPPPDDG